MTLQPLFSETIPAGLQGASDRLALAARSPATLRAYRTDWSAFVDWCHAQDVTALPAQPETVSAWIASRLEQGRKAATLIRGMRRMLNVQPNTLIGLRNRALLALGFAGALRRSELVTLEVTDLVPQEGGALLTLRRSKTDPYEAGQTIRILNVSTIRALDYIATWCEAAGITSGRLFRSVERHGRIGRSLSDRSVVRIIKGSAEAVGFDPERFSGHSLRAGFVTSGADALLIAETSRHQSLDMLRTYVRRASLLKTHTGHRFL
ncbi:tyrosine-type recombinase/integrase [Gluconobacter sphaericus]|uniref:Integrase n=1 Tax=Gluconobacter sphaericus NBRC 12467 TaxID=1307951 RepID=A0AA37SCS9_9PROT|nr:tyrosine-type recombinase/integrase [Gluconobacter sphaericus]GBR55736.1 phage DNA recombinase [Gluconobacter sphaericus NBRC 12467]GEB44034.1 hypothetical protein GSP01_28160 [Gluconobacter sphaericus NBRC 12467]GLQ83095.1 hypothetical protein GCM10007872_00030 [Gluconobacter sphaericus NBRC 12467]